VADDGECSGDAGALRDDYERLRAAVLSGAAGGWRLGHGVLCARGMVGWISAVGALAGPGAVGAGAARPTPPSSANSREAPSDRTVPLPGADQVVQVLAQMVLPLAA
jgi:hypothetical protein